jgi:hypothetical protein
MTEQRIFLEKREGEQESLVQQDNTPRCTYVMLPPEVQRQRRLRTSTPPLPPTLLYRGLSR